MRPNRRRFLQIAAAASAASLMRLRSAAAAAELQRWEGSALGADASMLLGDVSEAEGEELFALALQEVERLEAIPWTTLCIDCKRLQERA